MPSISLPPRCDRTTVKTIVPELLALQGQGVITIDASAVTQAGQALLQLLVSARASGDGANIVPSDALRDAAQLAGLGDNLFPGEMS